MSYPEAAEYFPTDKIAYTGNPIRRDLLLPLTTNAHAYLKLDRNIPTILVLGGSQGSQIINDTVLEALPKLLETYQVVHQTGKKNIEGVRKIADAVLLNSAHKDRYRPYDYLDALTLRSAAGAADIVVSRAGSSIFEIASWGTASIIIPIQDSNGNHQAKNAFAYARTGAAIVIEEPNLTGNILTAEIRRILDNKELLTSMKEKTKEFLRPQAARLIADEIMKIALRHEVNE